MTISIDNALVESLRAAVRTDRLLDTAVSLIEIPSPTQDATAAADRLASILEQDGFAVERHEADWPQSPAVVARLESDAPGKTIHFHGHLDTVHLPFVAPRVEDGLLHGSGASDMKGGVAAMCEATRILRDTKALPAGGVLITAVDMHEGPWGDGRQVKALVDAGTVGDAVLIPEYHHRTLPVMGRGMAILEVLIRRDGEPCHEVQGGMEQPRVISAGAELVQRLDELHEQIKANVHELGDRDSLFIGQVGAGEIYNQSPTEFRLSGTRRWLPGTDVPGVERQFRDLLASVEKRGGIQVEGTFNFLCDTFELDREQPIVSAFQSAYSATCGQTLPLGGKPFLDDGNVYIGRGKVPAITHGPDARGAHTVNEQVPVTELERVALHYALTAVCFCGDRG